MKTNWTNFRRNFDRVVYDGTARTGRGSDDVANLFIDKLFRINTKCNSEIYREISIRDIKYLVHFTLAFNVSGILKYGLIPRGYLEKKPLSGIIPTAFPDDNRLAKMMKSNCISVSFPDYNLFSLKRKEIGKNWAIILIDPNILSECPCIFYKDSATTNVEKNNTSVEFTNMFDDYFDDSLNNSVRKSLKLPESFTTNPQAEILVNSVIPPKYINKVCLEKREIKKLIESRLDVDFDKIFEISDYYFNPRLDHFYWDSKNENNVKEAQRNLINHQIEYSETNKIPAKARRKQQKPPEAFNQLPETAHSKSKQIKEDSVTSGNLGPARNSDIISFFINCLEAESFESLSLPRNKQSIYDLDNHMLGIENILNGNVPYFEIQGEPYLNDFIAYRNKYKQNDKIYLSVDVIPKEDRYGDSFLPVFIIEVLVEEVQESNIKGNDALSTVRISTVDITPTFNHSLLDESMTIHDRFLLMEEISEESDWEAKKQLYLNNIDKTFSKFIITKPVLFLSSDLQSFQSAVAQELEWINQRFLNKLHETSLASVFDRDNNITPQYLNQIYIEIFPLNKVQRDVVRFALTNPFTVITGPPGTGKSQVVLNLLANIYINEKTVLFASKNNKAVNTVIDKLESIKAGFCPFIRLGNKNEKQKGLKKIIDGLEEYYDTNIQPGIFDEIVKLSSQIDQLYKKLHKAKDQFNTYCAAARFFSIKSNELPPHISKGLLHSCIEQYETTCIKLINDLATYEKDYSNNQQEILILSDQIKNAEVIIDQLKRNLTPFYLIPNGDLSLPAINDNMHEELLQFIDKIELQQIINSNNQILFDEKQTMLDSLQLEQQRLKSKFDEFIETSFDTELKTLLENRLSDISDSIDVSFFELNQLKADLENFNLIKNKHISLIFFYIRRPFFKRNCYSRFKTFLSKQPDFISRYSVTKTTTLNTEALYNVLVKLIKIPECVDYLKNINNQNNEIEKVQDDKLFLLDKLQLKNFKWIEEGVNKFSEFALYKLPKSEYQNHFDFTTYWHETSQSILYLINNIIEYSKVSSQILQNQSKVEMLLPKVNIKYYDFIFDEIDKYIQDSSIRSKPTFNADCNNRSFAIYLDILQDSKNIINILKELSELEKKCQIIEHQIESDKSIIEIDLSIEKKQKELVEKSIAVFNHHLSNKISKDKAKFQQIVVDYFDKWKDNELKSIFESLKHFMGIFVTTNLSTRYNIPNMPALFDFVIIDEASQNDIASILPLLFRAKHAIFIGDPNQLRHITHLKNHLLEKFAETFQLGSALIDYHYIKRSAYDLSAKVFQQLTGRAPFVLRNHYRCHQDIIQFSNYQFYDSKLFPKSYIQKDISPLRPGISWRNVQGNYKDHTNLNEVNSIVAFIEELQRNGLSESICTGIITPFRNQKNLLIKLLSQKRLISGKLNDRIQASTVHSFQGDERDIIIYSPVISSGINERTQEWLDKSTDLLNVAITRARNALVIFGDVNYCMQTTGIHKKFLKYCLSVEESNLQPDFESRSEQVFYEALKSAGLNFEYQVPIGRYRADFILKQEDKFLCIELDGEQHNQTKSYDHSRDRYFEELGYTVLRIPNIYAENNISEIMSLLKKIVF